LREALNNSRDNKFRANIAEALGGSTHAESSGTLLGLMADGSEGVAMAAVRALAEQGTPAAVNALNQALYNESTPLNVRCEAAVGLGNINQPGVVDSLSRAASTITDDFIVGSILEALGSRPISETQSFFQSYLRSSTVSSEFKLDAIKALGQVKGDASALLMEAARDKDPELRAEAAWAMSNAETEGKVGSDLTTMLQNETDPDVRKRLYQALGNQESFDVSTVKTMVEKETDASARLAGLDLLAMELRNNPSQDLSSYFDQTAVAELKKLALTGEISQDRLAAVIALKRAGTGASQAALQEIAQNSTDKRILDATRPKLVKGR
jgi:HEAT repeat protein